MHLFSLFPTLGLSDMLFLVPMAFVGFVLTSEVPYHSRVAHYSFEAGGAVIGLIAAVLLLSTLRALF